MQLPIIPYQSPGYFLLLLVPMIPMAICLIKGHRAVPYQIFLNVAFLLLCFSGESWPQGVALIAFTIWQAILAKWYKRYRSKANERSVFFAVIFLAILPLIIVKGSPYLPEFTSFFGFLGISYVTFRSVQVLIEIRDALIKDLNIRIYLRFLLFFPTISSGPIDRYRNFLGESTKVRLPREATTLIFRSVHLIFIGLLYKFILGTLFGIMLFYVRNNALGGGVSILWLILYMYVYSLYLFFDFAGYSLFAIGTAGLMGFEIPVNFNKPFLSVNIKDFWN
ncbi:MAG: D-alanyl-lipoteichoic acid biosynthesis protein DltB, partial [Clostridiales Family XIII bacterium]|nr:D-alanyl-lipoteichoic acid biosynthesis protein DltB [Clostridiales Family XIII bacterium]